jgi:sigma-B regulation protein RsbU (phosphoserine phosphatase)
VNTSGQDDQKPEQPVDALRVLRHDLLSPLNQILGYSELVEEIAIDAAYVDVVPDLKKIQGAARGLEKLISERLVAESWTDLQLQSAAEETPATVATNSKPGGALESERKVPDSNFVGRVLVVDDQDGNREVLSRHLMKQGLTSEVAETGEQALAKLANGSYDLVLLDVLMPGLSGLETLQRMKSDEVLKHIPVLMISAFGELDTVCQCIEAGAEDYLAKPINTTLLRSRLGACLEKKRLRDTEQKYLRQIESTQRRLAKELQEAEDYLTTVFPEPLQEPFPVHWKHEPCSELGGDAFGYHWIDDDHFAFYILDVCGHGVRAALLAVSAVNVMRSGVGSGIDWRNPGQVLTTINNMFLMEKQNNMFFTLWYGVYNRKTRELTYSGAGHPAALVAVPNGNDGVNLVELASQGTIVGIMEDLEYETSVYTMPQDARLYLITDGCFEIVGDQAPLLEIEELYDFLAERSHHPSSLDEWHSLVRERHPEGSLDDDFTMLSLHF